MSLIFYNIDLIIRVDYTSDSKNKPPMLVKNKYSNESNGSFDKE